MLNFSWHWSPGTLIFLLILCLLYGFGVWQAHRRDPSNTPLKTYHLLAFGTAILGIALVMLTPIDTIARTQLFAAHMLQAVVLITVCGPMLLLACPRWLLRPLVEYPLVRPVARLLTKPMIASGIFNLTFLLWHAPGPFHFALQHGTVYHIELLSILLTSLLNWWPLIGPVKELRNMSYPMQMLYAFVDGQPVDIFAFLLVFTGTLFYPYYAIPSQLAQFGVSPIADQTIGGALLLLPGLVDLVVMSPLFFRWLGQIEEKAKIADQQRQEEMEAEAALLEMEGIETSEA
ncbi:MAG TPA: cytochrome c oxidase assembly protein [Ktedonobacteraceae bacterium]|nr:cytochrome c oxidase assembly protein [Ktedonobacteraceae bacterium]